MGNLRRKAELERINQENKIELMLLRKRRRDVKIADENQVAVTLRDRKRVRLESCIDSTIDTAF